MPDVRGAFMTRDRATIRDTAERLWSEVSEQDADFLVLDPAGNIIASLGGDYPDLAITDAFMQSAMLQFPKQVNGYLYRGSHLYYVVLTPVYVEAETGQGLLNILLVAFDINDKLADALKSSTHGSDFAFVCGDRIVASTLPLVGPGDFGRSSGLDNGVRRMVLHGTDYVYLGTHLDDIKNRPIGDLYTIRSFVGPARVLAGLQKRVALFWLLAIAGGLALTYLLARRILEPVKRLDHAVEQVTRRNYDYRVPVESEDELGRLAQTFNAMCDSLQSAREELIRQERIATIGRLSTSLVHDLRNPLAAIYGGAEMLVDSQLSQEQWRRLAANIYRASRRIQELLDDLVDVSRAKAKTVEVCRLADVVSGACESVSRSAELQSVHLKVELPADVEVSVERDRVERVFINLFNNALEAMPDGGTLQIVARREGAAVIIRIEDTGPGIPDQAWSTLFQPFASFGKKNGLGLGLALSRQTIVDHGGDLWAEKKTSQGACFFMRLPTAGVPFSPKTLDELAKTQAS